MTFKDITMIGTMAITLITSFVCLIVGGAMTISLIAALIHYSVLH